MQIRSNCESVAFLRSGAVELTKTTEKFTSLLKLQTRLIFREYLLNSECIDVLRPPISDRAFQYHACFSVSISLADYLGSILSYIILAIPIFSGVYDDKSATEISSIISAVRWALTCMRFSQITLDALIFLCFRMLLWLCIWFTALHHWLTWLSLLQTLLEQHTGNSDHHQFSISGQNL